MNILLELDEKEENIQQELEYNVQFEHLKIDNSSIKVAKNHHQQMVPHFQVE